MCVYLLSDIPIRGLFDQMLKPLLILLPLSPLCVGNVVKCVKVDVRVTIDVSFQDLQKS